MSFFFSLNEARVNQRHGGSLSGAGNIFRMKVKSVSGADDSLAPPSHPGHALFTAGNYHKHGLHSINNIKMSTISSPPISVSVQHNVE